MNRILIKLSVLPQNIPFKKNYNHINNLKSKLCVLFCCAKLKKYIFCNIKYFTN